MNLNGKRVFIRADLNVPIVNGKIIDNYRIKSILPTLDWILENGGKIILATHIDRPKKFEKSLSTENLIPWFKKHGYNIKFHPDLSKIDFEGILLLDNLRFYPGEEAGDKKFAEKLANLADLYINDAFGVIHRKDASIAILPLLFPPERRALGPLVEKEIKNLNRIQNPDRPFVAILGGGKIKDKISLIKNLKTDDILLCPAIVFTFLKALDKPIGKSLVDDSSLNFAKEFNGRISFPLDYQVAKIINGDIFSGPLSIKDSIPDDSAGISIGPKTINAWKDKILDAKTIFFNGAFGDPRRKETLQGMKAIFELMASSKAFTVIAGGDSVAAARMFGFENKINYLSTGGGSALALLSGEKLPGYF